MTCIVGLEHDGMVSIGGDSAGVNGSLDIRIRTDEKVFINGPMIFGFTSSYRMGQLLRYSLKISEQMPSQNNFGFMCTTFIDDVRKCLKDGGYARVKDNEETGGYFLVGYRGKLYRVESDFQVGKTAQTFDACGCGEAYALGAMSMMEEFGWSALSDKPVPASRLIELALQTAAKFSAGVAPPFFVLSSNKEKT